MERVSNDRKERGKRVRTRWLAGNRTNTKQNRMEGLHATPVLCPLRSGVKVSKVCVKRRTNVYTRFARLSLNSG
jgi:hypothetical protein